MMESPGTADHGMIAVTGATGFIGSHLLSHLVAQQKPLRALVRHKKKRNTSVPNSTEVVAGTLSDRESILALLEGTHTCVHLAGATTSVDANGFHTANVIGTYNLAACALSAGVEHLIYVSSQAARAPMVSDYAASKAMSEAALSAFEQHMRITIIRPPVVIGVGDAMLQPMFNLIRSGWLPAPAEPKGKPRSFAVISVEDLVSQISEAIESPGAVNAIWEPCSVPSTDWPQIASTAGQVLDRKVRIVRIWPALMKGLAFCADALVKLTRRPLPLSQDKVRELVAVDWTYDHPVQDAMNLKEMFASCLVGFRPKSPNQSGN